MAKKRVGTQTDESKRPEFIIYIKQALRKFVEVAVTVTYLIGKFDFFSLFLCFLPFFERILEQNSLARHRHGTGAHWH